MPLRVASTISFLALMVLGISSRDAAVAAQCKPLTILSSIQTVPVQGNLAVRVPAKVDGHRVVMLLDTGGVFSEISDRTAAALDLDEREAPFQIVDVAGRSSHRLAHATAFTLGRLHTSSIDFIVYHAEDDNPFNGVIAPNILTGYDVEFDFAAHRVNLLSQDHCPGRVIYWHPRTVAVVPIRVARSGHIIVPVMLDGHSIDAMIDTGASRTTLSQTAAEGDFGLKLGSASSPYAGPLPGSPHSNTYRHRFATLDFGGVAVANLTAWIIPDLMHNEIAHAPALGSRLSQTREPDRLPDLILGMDVLRHLHLYVAYKEQKMYVTPGKAPASTTGNTAATAAVK